MLTYLNVKNFAIIDSFTLEFQPNLTVLTGETGAGKSIIIDTLDMVLGARFESNTIRVGADRCEITAIFDLKNLPEAKAWLEEHNFNIPGDECIIRRTISTDGRSRSTINDYLCTQQLVRELGNLLVIIHGQHEHQALLKREKQRDLLDAFAQHQQLCINVKNIFADLSVAQNQLLNLRHNIGDREAKMDLLRYQLSELANLGLVAYEIESLHKELKQLSNAEKILTNCHAALSLINDENTAQTILNNLYRTQELLAKTVDFEPKISIIQQNLYNAVTQVELVAEEIKGYLDNTDLNAERLVFVENRINALHDIARKHRVKPEELLEVQERLLQELNILENAVSHLEQSEKLVQGLEKTYLQKAQQLSQNRAKEAKKLSLMVTNKMQSLGMLGGTFSVILKELGPKEYTAHGLEQVDFFVSTNPGQPLLPLNKVVSGGELSRISLAIQVITAASRAASTLIFDEVDVGVGGKTAEVVGQLLKQLGAARQILCITHLPQVAAQGKQHLQVVKNIDVTPVLVNLHYLNQKQRTEEIARMLGGINITATTLAHAQEMLHFDADM